MDILAADEENLKNVMAKMKQMGIRILAEKIETEEEYRYYKEMGFDLFQYI